MITPEFLQSCTDEQINKGVAWILTAKKCDKWACNGDSEFYYHWGRAMINRPSDYCGQIIHAWPIMMDNNISVFPRPSKPFAKARTYAFPVYAKNGNSGLLRAAMEVYIIMSTDK